MLQYPDCKRPFTVATDASDYAVRAVLQQEGEGGMHPVAFFSRKLKGAEVNWTTSGKEALAHVLALKECDVISKVSTLPLRQITTP